MNRVIFIMASMMVFLFMLCPKVSSQDFAFAEPVNYYAGGGTWFIDGADLNGDGLIDLFTTNRDGSISIFFNLGGGIFQDAINIELLTLPYSICAADIDGDGDKDLIIANHNSIGSFSILLNDGTGNFTMGPTYMAGSYAWSIAAADLDNDGDMDIVLSTEISATLYIFLNNGYGLFSSPESHFTGNSSHQVLVASLNKDSYPDLIVAGGISDYVSVLFNNSDGTFQAPVQFTSGDNVISIAVSDLNNDGRQDIASVNYFDGNFLTMFNQSGGSFEVNQRFTYSSLPTYAVAADLDGDSWKELIIKKQATGQNVLIMRNQGFGQYVEAGELTVGDYPMAICVADFDYDGDIDFATANLGEGSISVLLNQTTTSIDASDGNIPKSFAFAPNYPNPFNAQTTIEYDIPENGRVTLNIYDILGHKVATLVNEYQQAGHYQVIWDAGNMATGVYYGKLQSGNKIASQKMVLLK
jgi:hypothetical protein